MKNRQVDTRGRAAETVMNPRRLGALQPNRLSAARSLYAKMHREHWRIELVAADIDRVGAGRVLYRVDAGGHVMHVVAFSEEPKMVDRSPRIIGSSWDIVGALIDGEVTDEELEDTRTAIPRLYAGRATPETLVWFRANRSIRVFDHVVDALSAAQQPDLERIAEVGYLLRNTGLDGNGTFGTKDFQNYGAEHPLATPYYAQLFTAYMMREISLDLVNRIARARSADAVEADERTRGSIAVGNGSALGLVLLTMNRPQLVNAWLSGYETLLAGVFERYVTAEVFARVDELLCEAIEFKEQDSTDYGVFPSGEAVAVDLAVVRRLLRKAEQMHAAGVAVTLGEVSRSIPDTVTPDAQEMFHSLLLELAPVEQVVEATRSLIVDERKQVDPTATVAQLSAQISRAFAWVTEFPVASREDRSRIWYKSRNSEEPRSGPVAEVPDRTNDLAVDLLGGVRELQQALGHAIPAERVGRFVARHPHLGQIVGYVQATADLPYATPHMDVRDDRFVPAYIIRLFNAFCYGLDKTRDVHQRNLRGLIFENAHFGRDLDLEPRDWRWAVSA
ncbi:hypothetical protein [Leucobacter sp. NPDC077196]|uniref:hypothetical protein n=1 Tax=Leucobacter sp. NPDC077196 TaxID=3154959 RepID=UPI00343FC4EC